VLTAQPACALARHPCVLPLPDAGIDLDKQIAAVQARNIMNDHGMIIPPGRCNVSVPHRDAIFEYNILIFWYKTDARRNLPRAAHPFCCTRSELDEVVTPVPAGLFFRRNLFRLEGWHGLCLNWH
jgi:hypothetical protein